MPCYHPLLGVWKGEKTASGSKRYEIIGNVDFRDCPPMYEHVMIPCGKCIGCRLDYSRSWADRMMLELEDSGKGLFLTLTYDNEHMPVSMIDVDGTVYGTFDKRDCQLFMKRLREYFSDLRIRFYLAGEYGPKTQRPHYHAILFGIGLDDIRDKVFKGKNELGQDFYISDLMAHIWKNGFILMSDVSWKTCAYVSRYVTKKMNGQYDLKYATFNQLPEFALMSRRPGLGAGYLKEHPECLDYSSIFLSGKDGSKEIRLPKYYLKKLKFADPEKYDKICGERRRFAEDAMILKLQKTGLGYLDYLEVEEEKRKNKIKILQRKEL